MGMGESLRTAIELGAKTIVMSGYLSHMPGGRASDHETL